MFDLLFYHHVIIYIHVYQCSTPALSSLKRQCQQPTWKIIYIYIYQKIYWLLWTTVLFCLENYRGFSGHCIKIATLCSKTGASTVHIGSNVYCTGLVQLLLPKLIYIPKWWLYESRGFPLYNFVPALLFIPQLRYIFT